MREFTALNAIAEIGRIAAAVELETHHALERAAKLVETAAKAEIGEYQDPAGPFAGWAELADRTKDERVKLGFTENEPGLRTGEMRDSIGHEVGRREAHIGSNDDTLVWFELGTVNQPPRSVLGIAAVKNEHKIVDIIGEGAVIGLFGEGMARKMRLR